MNQQKMRGSAALWLVMFGVLALAPYAYTLSLSSLRRYTPQFLAAYAAAFVLYAAATIVALRMRTLSRAALVGVFIVAAAMMALLVVNRPTLSDDMYRYVWDGRVQAAGISPYRYTPAALELADLRDDAVWRYVNRKSSFTIYPPAAQVAFTMLWRIVPDSVRWFQAAMALSALLAGGLLLGLLRDLGRSPARVVIYLWAPLLLFETAHGAHVDALILPLLVGAWWARVRNRDALMGVLLGLATAVKLYPAMLLPALWRPADRRGRWTMPAAFVLTVAACYAPYVLRDGSQVLGFLPVYFNERFNLGLAALLIPQLKAAGVDPNQGILALTLAALAALALWMVARPAADGEAALRRSLWLIGAFTLLTQNLFSWYMLWVLPLAAIFVQPGRLLGLRGDAWTGWWLFCGSIGLSYAVFITGQPAPWAMWAQYGPLYALLLVDAARRLGQRWPSLTGRAREPAP
jgi:hypothetical protein